MAKFEIVVLDKEDLLKFNWMYYDDLLLDLPEDDIILGAINTESEIPQASGLLIFHVREEAIFVDWIYVDDECRGQGVGTMLMDYLKDALIQTEKETGTNVIFVNFPDTVKGLGKFLKENDFGVTFFDGNFSIYAPLKSVKLMRPNAKPGKLVAMPLAEVPKESLDGFETYLDLVESVYEGVVSPIVPTYFRDESRAILDGNRIVGIMLVGNTIYENNVMIDWVYSIPKYVMEAVPLAFDTVITELRKNVPEDTNLSMASLSSNVGGIIRKTMPGAVFAESYSAFWMI